MLLISTSSLTGYGLHRVFCFAKDAWYEWIDISLGMLNFDLWDAEYISELSLHFKIPVVSITAPGKDMSQKKLDKIMEIGRSLWVKVITFSPPHFMDKDTKWFGETLQRLQKNEDIEICVQNVESKYLFFVIPEYRNATLGKIKTVTGKSTLDIPAIDTTGTMDIMRAQAELWASIKNIFFADRNASNRWILPGTAWAGLSHLPLESFLMKMKSTNYEGHFTLKVSPKEIWVWNEEMVLKNLRYIQKYYSKHFLNFSEE